MKPYFPLMSLATMAGILFFLSPPLQAQSTGDEKRKVLFVAGPPSHGYGSHEHYAGCMLLARSLETAMDNFEVDVIRHQWPGQESALQEVDAVVIYSDGGRNHPAMPHRPLVNQLANDGTGIVCIHYSVEMLPDESGEDMRNWIGGHFETNWSVNPHWTAEFSDLPEHPITRGVQPFRSHDEWYFHMRFPDQMEGVTPILSAVPPESTMTRPDGPHSGNPHVRRAVAAGQPQHVAWAVERPGGGRGFGFTGGHFHWNWADDNFRRTVLNAIVWAAHGEVPAEGVPVRGVGLKDLKKNQDYDQPDNMTDAQIRQKFLEANR